MPAQQIIDWLDTVVVISVASSPAVPTSKRRRDDMSRASPEPESSLLSPVSQKEGPESKRLRSLSTPSARGQLLDGLVSQNGPANRSPVWQDQQYLHEPTDNFDVVVEAMPFQFTGPQTANDTVPIMRRLDNLGQGCSIMSMFFVIITKACRGDAILRPAMRDDFAVHPNPEVVELANDESAWCWGQENFEPPPDVKTALEILTAAKECSVHQHPESTWSRMVFQRILKAGFNPVRCDGALSSMNAATEEVTPQYMPITNAVPQVDFRVYGDCFDPDREFSRRPLEATQNLVAAMSIDHTDHSPLRGRSMAVSIKTVKDGESFEDALESLGRWEAARWNEFEAFARNSYGTGLSRVSSKCVGAGCPDPGHFLPPFLPAIIIQDHDWRLVVTSRENSKTVLWVDLELGSTSTLKGIYQIINTLQIIKLWIKKTYASTFPDKSPNQLPSKVKEEGPSVPRYARNRDPIATPPWSEQGDSESSESGYSISSGAFSSSE